MTDDVFIGELGQRFRADGLIDKDWKGLQIEVMSREEAENYTPESNDEMCISIKSVSKYALGADREAVLSDKFHSILYLAFDDTEIEMQGAEEDVWYFTRGMADNIVQFVKGIQNKKKLVIHCFAGISRSRSVAAAIVEYLQLPYNFTVYNKTVYNMLMKEFENDDARTNSNI